MAATTGIEKAADLSFRQLRVFETIGDLKSVRRASEECGLSQPAVTQALAKLEQKIGAELVDRCASGSYLNELGAVFHARVKRFFQQIAIAITEAGAAATPESARWAANRLTRSQIRILLAVIAHGSRERASEALDISATSLQRAARILESNLRISLFYRTGAGMIVSPIGVRFGSKVKLALQEIEWGIEELESAQGCSSRQIVVGAMPSGGSVLVASILDDFLRLHPHADIRILNDSAALMIKSLAVGDVDVVIGLLPEAGGADLVSEALAQTPYLIVARRGHPLARKGRVTLDDLLAYDWVQGHAGSRRRASFEHLFAGRSGPRSPITTSAINVIRHLVGSSDRLTLMTTYELEHEDPELCAIPFSPILPVPSIGITKRANWLPTRLHADFIEMVRAHVAAKSTSVSVRKIG
ncbi:MULTISPECIES: LysR substrate-binding domain-containing protein [unclassified Beijerinckia]|uniref:LysR substrate-binding domain-containing protein n=1 Tax=unclassified Beijerinckia TaxID=2638183 RepID=UPI000894B8B1|nr:MULTISPECIES: LysR substrate-binding domain-containing protein [unclassified Beijerinckia]MDH7798832.1 LysR family transcriptional regulator of gallate degradation [Beijerinckia sp. GAS462]SED89477.1 DNA-binding transcriptional regulator, LysR family [Beijerinckia sp. 28-YEA-48]